MSEQLAAISEFITPAALAKKLAVSPKTVRRMITAGAFPVLAMTDRMLRIPVSAINEYLAARTIPAVTTGEKR